MPNHFPVISVIVEGIVGADLRVCPKNKGEHRGFAPTQNNPKV
jgi:hypothetical protein